MLQRNIASIPVRKADFPEMTLPNETRILVLQGGGALGAYQAGAYEALASAGDEPEWVAGISIGAINAAIIAGNRPEDRVKQLRASGKKCPPACRAHPSCRGITAAPCSTKPAAGSQASLACRAFLHRAFHRQCSPCRQPKPP